MAALAQTIQRFIPKPSNRKIGPIGLEFSLEALHMVQMESDSAGKLSLRARASIPFSEGRDAVMHSSRRMKSLVRHACKVGSFQGKKVVASMPANKTRILSVSYQLGSGQGDAEAILQQMSGRLEGELSEYVLDYMPVRSNPNTKDRLAIVAVAKRDDIIEYLEQLRSAGLVVDALEIGPAAIRRMVSSLSEPDKFENVLVINFGRTVSYLTIISKSRLLFDQEIKYGENMVLELIASSLEIPVEDAFAMVQQHGLDSTSRSAAEVHCDISISETLREIVKPTFLNLVEEINRALIYAASETHGESVNRVYMLGGIARWAGADKYLKDLIDLPVETIPNPLKTFSSKSGADTEVDQVALPEIAVATGLALRGMMDRD